MLALLFFGCCEQTLDQFDNHSNDQDSKKKKQWIYFRFKFSFLPGVFDGYFAAGENSNQTVPRIEIFVGKY